MALFFLDCITESFEGVVGCWTLVLELLFSLLRDTELPHNEFIIFFFVSSSFLFWLT